MDSQRKRRKRRTQDLEVLYKISNIINTTLDRKKVLRAVLKEVVRITAATSGSIAMFDAEQGILNIETAINIPAKMWKRLKLQLGVGVTGWVAFKGEALRIDDVRRDSHYVSVKPDIMSELAVPMFLQGKVIGVINVDSTEVGAFTEEDERLLQAVADQSAQVIETARLYEESRRYNAQMEALFALGRDLTSPAPLEKVLGLVTSEGRRLLDADVCVFIELTEDREGLVIRAQEGANGSWQGAPRLDLAHTLLAPVIERNEVLHVPDLRQKRPFWNGAFVHLEDYRTLLAVPVTPEDEIIGALAILTVKVRSYHESDESLLQLLGNQLAVAIAQTRRRERMLAIEENMQRVERFSVLGTMAAELAHEIRNPITIINLLLDSLSEELAESSQARGDLQIVREKIERIERIVGQTLDLARQGQPEREAVQLNQVASDVLVFLNYKFEKLGIQVRTDFDRNLPTVPADRGQIQQVLLNLFMNALQAMDGGGKLLVSTAVIEDAEIGECVTVEIVDSGKGIPRETLGRLFEPFYTTRRGGTGLGLFISRKLVTAHGGDLRVASREGKGSTFSLILPLTAPAEADADAPAATETETETR